MREIKFRAWDTYNERMVEQPYLFQPSNDVDKIEGDERFNTPYTYYEDWRDCEDGVKRPCYIMQYTCMKDRFGLEIYEGDILISMEGVALAVEYIDHGFYLSKNAHAALYFNPKEYNVIGNIYENPELLTQTK